MIKNAMWKKLPMKFHLKKGYSHYGFSFGPKKYMCPRFIQGYKPGVQADFITLYCHNVDITNENSYERDSTFISTVGQIY